MDNDMINSVDPQVQARYLYLDVLGKVKNNNALDQDLSDSQLNAVVWEYLLNTWLGGFAIKDNFDRGFWMIQKNAPSLGSKEYLFKDGSWGSYSVSKVLQFDTHNAAQEWVFGFERTLKGMHNAFKLDIVNGVENLDRVQYLEGVKARIDGIPETSNPYKGDGSWESGGGWSEIFWRHGWEDGKVGYVPSKK